MSLYSALSREENEIRLLTLHPGARDTPLKCALSQVSLHLHYHYTYKEWDNDYEEFSHSEEPEPCSDHHPSYEALSYEWGPKLPRCPIEINDQPKTISSNLSSALQRLRKPNQNRLLWVDALCINQEDNKERSSQVQCIAAIYQRAERVLIWLGEASEDSDLAIDTLNKLGGVDKQFSVTKAPGAISAGPHFSSFRGNMPFEYRNELSVDRLPDLTVSRAPEWLQQMFEENKRIAEQLNLISVHDLGHKEWTALENFFKGRTWWKRVWIIQEVAFARDALLFCGSKCMQWATLHDLWRQESCNTSYRFQYLMGISALPLDMARSTQRNPMRALGCEPVDGSLLYLLARYRSWKSTDAQDKIYALLGLASISKDLLITPDYDKDVEDVFCDATAAIIKEDQNLDILSQVHRLDGQARRDDWPSWVPDWTTDNSISFLINIKNGLRPYDAGGKWTASYAVFDPDTGGRLRSGWRKAMYPARKGLSDGLVHRPKTSISAGIGQPSSQASATGGGEMALITPEGKLAILPRSSQGQPSYATELPQRKLQVQGVLWDVILRVSDPISTDALRSREYRLTLRRWMASISRSVDPARPEVKAVDVQLFMLTLLRGQVALPAEAISDPELQKNCIAYLTKKFLVWIEYISEGEAGEPPVLGLPAEFDLWIPPSLYGWSFAITRHGHFGLVPSGTERFDAVCIILGSSVPFVLRQSGKSDEWEWEHIGTGYFYHIMAGEVYQLLKDGEVVSDTFVLA